MDEDGGGAFGGRWMESRLASPSIRLVQVHRVWLCDSSTSLQSLQKRQDAITLLSYHVEGEEMRERDHIDVESQEVCSHYTHNIYIERGLRV